MRVSALAHSSCSVLVTTLINSLIMSDIRLLLLPLKLWMMAQSPQPDNSTARATPEPRRPPL